MDKETRLATMRVLLKDAQEEHARLHEEVTKLSVEEALIHRAQQAAVHKRNAMSAVVGGLIQVVQEMETDDG